MKRGAIWLLIALLCFFPAFSEEYEPTLLCDCGEKICICFLQQEDIGPAVQQVIVYLKERGYLNQKHSRGVFDAEVTLAVMLFQKDQDLEMTGMLDDARLTALIFDGLPESMYMWNEKSEILLWIPSDGGKRKHIKPGCSGMLNPRKISALNAEALMIEPCGRCMRREKYE